MDKVKQNKISLHIINKINVDLMISITFIHYLIYYVIFIILRMYKKNNILFYHV